MPDILIYSTTYCPYCTRAKALLDRKGAKYQEILVDESPELREEMVQKSQRQTVPQIFIDNRHIGGFDDLYALDQNGELDPLLNTEN